MNTPQSPEFKDRMDAGTRLADAIGSQLSIPETVILALPRGGIPIAAAMCKRTGAHFDVLIVRKLGVPGHDEYAMGAIASGGVMVLRQDVIERLQIPTRSVDAVVARETKELRRREEIFHRGSRPLDLAGRTVVLVDDGMATGSTMLAAVELLRRRAVERIIVAVPVASMEAVEVLKVEADEVVALVIPETFVAVGLHYGDFGQITDQEAGEMLRSQLPPAHVFPPIVRSTAHCPDTLAAVRREARPITGDPSDFNGLLHLVGDATVVLLGEASHGTHEFYSYRGELTRRLMEEKGFNAVAIEGDWPDAYRVNRYVRGMGTDHSALEALSGFKRFPEWMWRNAEVRDFAEWLREFNSRQGVRAGQAGFYGLDLYSLHKSMDEVCRYLDRVDPEEARRARARYACMDRHGPDPQNYGLLVSSGLSAGCRDEVIEQLVRLRAKEVEYLGRDGAVAEEEFFFAAQNARLVRNAELYYRKMFRSDVSSWNLRDQHMMEMLVEIIARSQTAGRQAKVVVWAHNSHVGDARATERTRHGELNLGQLVREAYGDHSRLIGFTTYEGEVTAATGWHLPGERKKVLPGMEGSYERLFHEVGIPEFWIDLGGEGPGVGELGRERLQRAIGVVYRPETERQSHYFKARLANEFDAVIHIDRTRPVLPLEGIAGWDHGEAPEAYPAGL